MAAVLAGEAAIRIVPSLAGFKTEADRRLKAYKFAPISVQINPDLARADAEMAKWRALQERNAININVKTDTKQLLRELSTVEHIFKRSALSQAVRLNVKVVGLDALPALAYAAGSAASGLDALGKSAFVLPGLVGGALASVAALAVGLSGVSNALKAYSTDLSSAADHTKTINQDNRQLADSYKDYKNAVKDTTREIQDLNAENRRSSLNVADAVLSVQEAANRLREGGQRSVLELRRDQLNYLQSIDRLQQVQTQAQRTAQDATEANAKGVEGADKVVDALDKIAKNTEKLDVDKITEVDKALAKLAPSARLTVEAIHALHPAWLRLQDSVQGNLFKDLDKDIANLGQTTLPGLEVGLSRVASGLNSNFRSIFQSIGKAGNQNLLSKIFGNTDGGLQRLSKAMDPLLSGFLKLTEVGTRFLPRLGDAAAKVFTRFEDFIDRVDGDGSLTKWIDQGLNSLTSLGNIGINIFSIVDKVAESFNKASGTQGGFLTTLERATGPNSKLMTFLKSGKLVDYFKRANEFIGHIGKAINDMRPAFGEIVDTAREWSGYVFSVVGALTETATWIDRNTGLLQPLIAAYLSFKTLSPLVGGLTASWRNYGRVVGALGDRGVLGFGNAAAGLNSFKKDTANATDAAAGSYRTLGQNVDGTKTKVTSLIDELNRLNKAIPAVGNASKFDPTGPAPSAGARANIDKGVSATTARTRALDAGIGLGDSPLQDRLAAGNAAYVQRLALRNADLLAARNEDMFRAFDTMTGADAARGAAGIGGGSLRDRLVSQTAAQRDRFGVAGVDEPVPGMGPLQGPIRPEPTGRQPQTQGSNSAGRRRQNRALAAYQRGVDGYLQDSYSLYDPDRKYSDGRSPAPARGAVQGPSRPPGFLPPGTTRAPALGKMEGPQLTPEFLRQLSAASDEATPKIQSVGDVADKTATNVTTAGDSSKTATPKVTALGDAAKTAAPKVTTASSAAKDLGTSSANAVQPISSAGEAAKSAAPKITTVGDEAAKAATKIAGSTSTSMLSRVGALAAGLGPGLALMVAIPLAMAAIEKLGEAHRNAARDAKAQTDALKGLAETLNGTTGAFTAQTLTDTLGKYKAGVPLGGGVNSDFKVLDAMSNLGLDARQETAIAANPAASGQFEQRQGARIAEIAKGIEASPVYQDNKGNFEAYGLDPLTLAKASVGEDAAFAKVEAAKNSPKFTTNERGAQEQIRVPDLGAIATSLPSQDLFGVSQVLQQTHDENVTAGANSLAVSQIAGGKPQFTDQGAGFFSAYAPDVASLTKDVAGAGIVQINKPVDQATIDYWRDTLGFTVGDPVPGTTTRAITIPAEKVDGWLTAAPGFADGGIVPGRGGPREDNIMIKASVGEHITQVPAVKHYGQRLFDDLNNMRIPKRAVGGFLGGGFKLDPALPSPTPPPVAPSGGGLGSLFLPPAVQAPQVGLPGPLSQLPSATPPPPAAPGVGQLPGQSINPDGTVRWNNFPQTWQENRAPSLAPPTVTTPPVTPGGAPGAAGSNTDSSTSPFRVMPGAAAPLPSEAGYTGTQLQNGLPYTGVDGSQLPSRFNETGLQVNSIGAERSIAAAFPQITDIGGVRPDSMKWHPNGLALDVMLPKLEDGSLDSATGNQVAQFAMANAQTLGVDYAIYNGNMYYPDGRVVPYTGSNPHTDHVHVNTTGGGYPAAGLNIPGVMPTLPGGIPGDFLTNGADISIFDRLKNNVLSKFGIAGAGTAGSGGRSVADGTKFLSDSLVGVASQAGTIGLEAIAGFFGLDLSYLNAAKQVGNYYLGGDDKSGTGGGDTALTDSAGNLLSQYQGDASTPSSNGQLDIGGALTTIGSGWGMLGASDLSKPGKKGGEAYRGLVRSIVKSQAPGLGIPPSGYKQWEDALVKQIDTESGGDPFSFNGNDSDGKGGKQTVKGLFNFLPTTFQSVVPGGNIDDPSAQIAGAMRLVAKKGLSATGGPPSYPGTIGEGHGFYADGGMPGNGNAMVSAGEYRTNPKAVAHYGPGLYSMLNSMSLPKGFADGGFPAGMVPTIPKIPEIPQIALPKIAPPAAGGGQSAGPLPLAPPGAAGQPGLGGRANAGPSTGGAPGPGATAPAPDPGVLPSVVPDIQGSLAGIGTGVGGGGGATIQPGASPNTGPDARGTLGAAPASTDHVNPALKGAIKAGAQIAGNIGAAAASAGSFGMPMPGMSQMIQGAADIGGQVVGNVANVFSSLLVGTATGGSTASASGVPLLPARPPTQTGVAPMPQRVHNGDINVTNLDEYKRTQERLDAQQSMPFIGKY